ncbi:hypothetical protein GCM10025883_09900 [Mobilicoccus caccae]|uniref:Uncharacterized protein n=1 Tax=Mobilicoccus caccae TaxID=1859295 RepID=A0ABQ6ILZ7_9MICO|nr:hypothetical protein GCM10025883_09900 [Mobilicoccus caccae]
MCGRGGGTVGEAQGESDGGDDEDTDEGCGRRLHAIPIGGLAALLTGDSPTPDATNP